MTPNELYNVNEDKIPHIQINNKFDDTLLKNYIKTNMENNNKKCILYKDICRDYEEEISNLKICLAELETILSQTQTQVQTQVAVIGQSKCSVCMSEPNNYINSVCGHMSVCENCAPRLDNKCPICRRDGTFIKVIDSGVE